MPTLTAVSVESAKRGSTRRELRDSVLPGFSLIVQPSGAKSWALRFWHEGKFYKLTLGSYPALSLSDAREAAREARLKLAKGINPVAEKKEARRLVLSGIADEDLVKNVWESYVALHLTDNPDIRESTSKRYKGVFEKYLLPKWKNRKLTEIRDTDILDMIDEAKKRGPAAANSIHTVLSAFLGWCMRRKRLAESPMKGMRKPFTETYSDRILNGEEIKLFWTRCEKINPVFGRMFQLLLTTGCRRNEISRMKWSELDLKNRIFTLPAERSKNGLAHRVYLNDPALAILEAMPRIDGCEYVFTTDGETASSGFSKSKTKLDNDTKLKDYTLHDLRRTMASGLAALGFSQTVTEKVLNHTSGTLSGVAGIYNRHSYEAEMKRGWEAWGNKIAALVIDRPSNVVAIRASGAGVGPARLEPPCAAEIMPAMLSDA